MEFITYDALQRFVVEVVFIWIVIFCLFGLSYWIAEIVRAVSKWRKKRKNKEDSTHE